MTAEEIIEKWVRVALDEADSYVFDVGEDISPYAEIKIAFDGYAEDEDGDEDESKQSFAVYIHKDSHAEDFEFPGHESSSWGVEHRPSEEVYHNVWYHRDDDELDYGDFAESVKKTRVPYDQIVSVIEALDKRLSASEE